MGVVFKKTINLYENMKLFENQKILKTDVKKALNDCKQELQKYNSLLAKAETNLNELQYYLTQMDQYLKDNCREKVKENPIDIESKLWAVNDENIDIASLNYKLNEVLNDPDVINYYDFNNPRFLEEIMQLINSQNFNSTDIDSYLKKFMSILEKYRLGNGELFNTSNKKSINVNSLNTISKPKAARAVNTSSYSDFVEKKKEGANNGPYYSRATTRKPITRKKSSKKPKISSCGHDHSKSGVICQ